MKIKPLTFQVFLVKAAGFNQFIETSKTVLCLQREGAAEPEISCRESHPSIIQAKCCLTAVFE
jgi:hypothetical protein